MIETEFKYTFKFPDSFSDSDKIPYMEFVRRCTRAINMAIAGYGSKRIPLPGSEFKFKSLLIRSQKGPYYSVQFDEDVTQRGVDWKTSYTLLTIQHGVVETCRMGDWIDKVEQFAETQRLVQLEHERAHAKLEEEKRQYNFKPFDIP